MNKGACLLLFCYLIRYSSFDGYFCTSLEYLVRKVGSKYNSEKNRHMSKLGKDFSKCLDYLISHDLIRIIDGNYNSNTHIFIGKINENCLHVKENYLSLSVSQFDYLLSLEGRINKSNMFLLYFWIINCSTDTNNGIINACSYSTTHMSEILGITQPSIIKYLSYLCGNEYSDAPLLCFKNETIKINGEFRRFPNIYVKNNEFAKENVELQKKYLKNNFTLRKVPTAFQDVVDYEDLY